MVSLSFRLPGCSKICSTLEKRSEVDWELWSPSDGFDLGDNAWIEECIRNSAMSRPDIEREDELSGGSWVGRSHKTHPGRTGQESRKSPPPRPSFPRVSFPIATYRRAILFRKLFTPYNV
jgi:hypothetical protein